jgi:hypothetical protein
MTVRGRVRPRWVIAPLVFVAVLVAASAAFGKLNLPAWVIATGGALLTFFLDEIARPLLQRARRAQEQEEAAADALRRHLGRREAPPLVSECDPLRLGVHPAIDLPNESSNKLDRRLPLYVGRDLDAELRTWLRETARRRGGFALITGGSSVGKTRFLYEAVRTTLPDFRLLEPYGDAAVVNVLGDSTLRLPELVVWLDELQNYLEGPWLLPGSSALNPSALRRLLDSDTAVVIVATMWPDRDHELRSSETDPALGRDRPKHPKANQTLKLAEFRRSMPDRPFSTPTERANLDRAATRDPRLDQARRDSHYAPTQVLAGARWLVDRWVNAPDESGKAVINRGDRRPATRYPGTVERRLAMRRSSRLPYRATGHGRVVSRRSGLRNPHGPSGGCYRRASPCNRRR